jgi:hypothetical protein
MNRPHLAMDHSHTGTQRAATVAKRSGYGVQRPASPAANAPGYDREQAARHCPRVDYEDGWGKLTVYRTASFNLSISSANISMYLRRFFLGIAIISRSLQ